MFEFGCCSHEVGPSGSFDSAYLTQLPLAGFVDAHHSSSLIWISCSEVRNILVNSTREGRRCVTNEKEKFIWQYWVQFQLSNCLSASSVQQLSIKHPLCIWESSMIFLLNWKALIHPMDADKLNAFHALWARRDHYCSTHQFKLDSGASCMCYQVAT